MDKGSVGPRARSRGARQFLRWLVLLAALGLGLYGGKYALRSEPATITVRLPDPPAPLPGGGAADADAPSGEIRPAPSPR